MPGHLPADAFALYLSLGGSRSYQAVAAHYGVSKRTVAARAKAEGWQAKVASVDAECRTKSSSAAIQTLEESSKRRASRVGELQDALFEVLTPQRFRGLVAALVKAAVSKDDVQAAKFLIERVLGKTRTEPLPAAAIDLPNGLESTSDVRRAANGLLQGVAAGTIAPEDAQKAAVVIEAARRSIETEELEKRVSAIEAGLKKEQLP